MSTTLADTPTANSRSVNVHELMSPVAVLAALRAELYARGISTSGMTVTRLQGRLTLADGLAVGICCGWLLWPTGRLSRAGRQLYAMHNARDPVGAARLLARRRPRNGS